MLKYNKFVDMNEAKKAKVTEDIEKALDELFSKCPTVTKSNDKWPTEKCLYSLSGIKKYVKDKVAGLKDNTKTDGVFQSYRNKLKSVSVKNREYGSYPYYYNPDKVTEEEAKKKKEEYDKHKATKKEKKD